MLPLIARAISASESVTVSEAWNITASNIFGSLAAACWVILLLPQLIEQWRLKSSEGLALGFLLSWLAGDVANLLGAAMGKLRPSLVLVGIWFCISDSALFASYLYYSKPHNQRLNQEQNQEQRPSLVRAESSLSPRSSPALRPSETAPLLTSESSIHGESTSARTDFLLKALPIVLALVITVFSYVISTGKVEPPTQEANWLAITFGYISAGFYLYARIPQIIRNQKRRSVEGLSLEFVFFSVTANFSTAAQVLLYRHDSSWLRLYMPWLLGTLGTIGQDAIILTQFLAYNRKKSAPSAL